MFFVTIKEGENLVKSHDRPDQRHKGRKGERESSPETQRKERERERDII